MAPENTCTAQGNLMTAMASIIEGYHPLIRTKMTLLKGNLAKLILLGSSQQHEWTSTYGLFFKLGSSLDSHMFHEETSLFPQLGAFEKTNRAAAGSDIRILARQMKDERQLILRQWKALEDSVGRIDDTPGDVEWANKVRFDLADLETILAEHAEFEARMIDHEARNSFGGGDEYEG